VPAFTIDTAQQFYQACKPKQQVYSRTRSSLRLLPAEADRTPDRTEETTKPAAQTRAPVPRLAYPEASEPVSSTSMHTHANVLPENQSNHLDRTLLTRPEAQPPTNHRLGQ
jgi:hypothetical protein